MSTITKSDLVQRVTLGNSELTDLLTGALVAADKSKSAPARLASVYLSYKEGAMKVQATDRYRLVIGHLHVGHDSTLDEIQLVIGDVKRILALTKEDKSAHRRSDSPITLIRDGGLLKVESADSSLLIELMGETFPDVSNIFKDTAAITSISLNADYLGSFAKVPSNSKQSQINLDFTSVSVAGQSVPGVIKIKVPHDLIEWTCALMPMRVKD